MTRQRVRPEMAVEILEHCPVCEGTGKIRPSIIFVDEIENNLKYLLQDQNEQSLTIAVHPYVHAYLTKGWWSRVRKWMWKYKKRIRVKPMTNYHQLEYKFFNDKNDEIKT